MTLQFTKYQGTGNDFIMIDDRDRIFPEDIDLIPRLCDRRKGVGADGLILIRNHPSLDFEMVYFNADGSQSMCGNGSRCAVNFAKSLGMVQERSTNFLSTDGPHLAILADHEQVELQLADVKSITRYPDKDLFINTGSPHHIRFVDSVQDYDVFHEGKAIREDAERYPEGTNVNFVEVLDDQSIYVRTFERGVENETLSCGTGVTAASLAAGAKQPNSLVKIKTLGGQLQVRFDNKEADNYHNVFL
ncbi:MAG: diaminopimelate epimerase, partial [Bacteroidota bacterium]